MCPWKGKRSGGVWRTTSPSAPQKEETHEFLYHEPKSCLALGSAQCSTDVCASWPGHHSPARKEEKRQHSEWEKHFIAECSSRKGRDWRRSSWPHRKWKKRAVRKQLLNLTAIICHSEKGLQSIFYESFSSSSKLTQIAYPCHILLRLIKPRKITDLVTALKEGFF